MLKTKNRCIQIFETLKLKDLPCQCAPEESGNKPNQSARNSPAISPASARSRKLRKRKSKRVTEISNHREFRAEQIDLES